MDDDGLRWSWSAGHFQLSLARDEQPRRFIHRDRSSLSDYSSRQKNEEKSTNLSPAAGKFLPKLCSGKFPSGQNDSISVLCFFGKCFSIFRSPRYTVQPANSISFTDEAPIAYFFILFNDAQEALLLFFSLIDAKLILRITAHIGHFILGNWMHFFQAIITVTFSY